MLQKRCVGFLFLCLILFLCPFCFVKADTIVISTVITNYRLNPPIMTISSFDSSIYLLSEALKSDHSQVISLSKRSFDGSLIWSTTIDFSSDNYGYNEILIAPDDSLYVLGHLFNSSDYYRLPMLMKFSSSGDLIYQTTFNSTNVDDNIVNYITLQSIWCTNDDNLFVIGENISRYRNSMDWVNDYRQIFFGKINSSNGRMIWNKSITMNIKYRFSEDIIHVSDGYLISGFKYNISNRSSYFGFLMKLDFDGNIVWDKTYSDSSY